MRSIPSWSASACVAVLLFSLAPSAQEPVRKPPIPENAALKRARDLVHEVFARDLKQASSAQARLALANVFAQQARENKDEPANRFVLLEEAVRQAWMAGDIHLALTLVDDLARDFEIDLLERKARVLGEASAGSPGADTARVIVDVTLPLLADAVETDQYDLATAFGKIALAAATTSRDEALQRLARGRVEQAAAVREGYQRLQGAIGRLKTNPDDPQANLELGRYHALLKNRWDRALPLLARGADRSLADLAVRDLASPKGAPAMLALADGWWDRALAEKEPARLALQARAAHWYEKALPHVAGLNRTKASKRLDRALAARSGVTGESSTGPVGELKKLEGHSDEVKAVALSHDGRFALSGSLDLTARLWDLGTGKEVKTYRGHTKQLWAVAFHPNGRWGFSTSWDTTARQWDLRSGEDLRRFTHRLDVNGLALSRGGDQLLLGSDDHSAYLWNIASGEEVRRFTGHTGFVYAVAFAPDGKTIATAGVDKSIRIHDLVTGGLVRSLEGHSNPVSAVAFSPDSRFLYSCGDGQPRQWETATGAVVRRYEGHSGYVLALVLSPDGRRLITGGDDKTIRLWDVVSGKELHKFQGHDGPVTSLALSQDGRHLVSGSTDRTVRLWGVPAR